MDEETSVRDAASNSRREHFIPIRAAQLVRWMVRQPGLSAADIQAFQGLADRVTLDYHRATINQLEDYLEDYSPFDPDQDLVYELRESPSILALRGERFIQQIAELMRTANYLHLSQEKLEKSLELAAGWGVRYQVDFTNFDVVQVYARGVAAKQVSRRAAFRPWRKETREIEHYQRVVMVFRLKRDHQLGANFSSDRIYLKIFKDIPQTEVDMMMPGSQVKFSWADRGKVLFPAIGGLFAGLRLAKALVIWGPRISLFLRFIALTSILKWVGGRPWFADWALNATGDGLNFTGWSVAAVLALTFYFVKYWLSHNRTLREHQGLLTTNLYLRNLGNNGSVLFQIMEEAKEQELRELLLGYYLLWRQAGPEGWTTEELLVNAQASLRRILKRDIDFEVADALRKLQARQWVRRLPTGHWVAVDLATASASLGSAPRSEPTRSAPL